MRSDQLATLLTGGAGFAGLAASIARDPDGIGRRSREDYDLNVTTPADYAFAIWGPIYAGLAGLTAHQALPGETDNPRYTAARPWLAATPAANAAWILLTLNKKDAVAGPLLVGMWGGALGLHRALAIGREPAGSTAERVVRLGPSLYAGWLSLALLPTIVNAGLAGGVTATPRTRPIWGAAATAGAAAAGLALTRRLNDPVVGGVFVWGLTGLAVRHVVEGRDPKRRAQGSRSPLVAAVAGGLALAGAALLLRRR